MQKINHISHKELMKLLAIRNVRGIRTINTYVKEGKLPQPERDGNTLFFKKDEVAKRLGVENLNEPFIRIHEAAKMLDISTDVVTLHSKKGFLPHYRLDNSNGTFLLFRRTELELVNEISNIAESFCFQKTKAWQIFEKAMEKFHWVGKFLRLLIDRNKMLEEDVARKRVQIKMLSEDNIKLRGDLGMEANVLLGADTNSPDFTLLSLTKLSDCDLSIRALNCLSVNGINTLGKLIEHSPDDLRKFQGFGKKMLEEAEDLLDHEGLSLVA